MPKFAEHASQKSGYAKDVLPERVESSEARGDSIPPATAKGEQEGRDLVVDRAPSGEDKYEAVDATEASRRLILRSKGQLPTLDDKQRTKQPQTSGDAFEPTGEEDAVGTSETRNLANKIAEIQKQQLSILASLAPDLRPAHVPAEQVVTPGVKDRMIAPPPRFTEEAAAQQVVPAAYKDTRRITIMIENGGTFAIPVHDILSSKTCHTVILPFSANSVTFSPTLGSSVRIIDEEMDREITGYYPGTYCELSKFNIAIFMLLNSNG